MHHPWDFCVPQLSEKVQGLISIWKIFNHNCCNIVEVVTCLFRVFPVLKFNKGIVKIDSRIFWKVEFTNFTNFPPYKRISWTKGKQNVKFQIEDIYIF